MQRQMPGVRPGAPERPVEKFTYTPESFYSPHGKRFNLAWVTPQDRAKHTALRAKARQLYAQLLRELENIPRIDQFEELVSAIRKLREMRTLI